MEYFDVSVLYSVRAQECNSSTAMSLEIYTLLYTLWFKQMSFAEGSRFRIQQNMTLLNVTYNDKAKGLKCLISASIVYIEGCLLNATEDDIP